MNEDSGFSTSRLLVSFVAGGLTGAAVALLLAPQSGRGARSLINQRIRDGLGRGRKARERMASRGREVLEGASNYIAEKREELVRS